MSADESAKINPYAPSTLELERAGHAEASFPESGIPFSGLIELPEVRNTRHGSLLVGLVLSLSFIGILLSAAVAMANGSALVVLALASGLMGVALWGFVQAQTDRPLLKFDWMQGAMTGRLHRHRLDIRWNEGESEGSFGFEKPTTELEFSNRYGRLFVIRAIPCFLPRQSVSTEQWEQVRAFHPGPASSGQSAGLMNQPVPSSEESTVKWPPADDRFFADRQKHEFVCRDPKFARAVFSLSVIILILIALLQQKSPAAGRWSIVMLFWFAAMFSGMFWLACEWRRRDWRFSSMPRLREPKPAEPPPEYERWIDENRLLVGYHDAWICVPWSAVQQATVSPYAIQFSFTPLGLDHWFLERGSFTDRQWQAIIHHLRLQTTKVSVWGAARRIEKQGVIHV